MTDIIKPKRLYKGDKIGICAPAWQFNQDEASYTKNLLESYGYQVFIHPQTTQKHFSLAGTIEQRVNALHDLFADSEIDAIFLARGGYGGIQLIEYLNFDLIRKNPKIIIGYSDNSILLQAIHAKTGIVTFHGPNCHRLLQENFDDDTTNSMFNVLSGLTAKYEWPDGHYNMNIVQEGEFEGRLLGGNHILMHSLIGTPYLPDFNDSIFFMESNRPKFYDIDQDLYHLRLAGLTRKIGGVIMGEMEAVNAHNPDYADKELGRSYDDMIKIHFPNVPSVTGFPCGHHKTLLTFPLGIRHRLKLRKNGISCLEMLEPACI